ncbi:MAG: hypothetical protein HGA63_09535 [Syntrophobacteraceae bacterium]|jgi:hypothetical protein|nr:hypothetical protein [Syntrophobacteraceae bacterium]NTV43526.1 hypothetical protein [Syntrophobacteraceae bacterium]
MNAYTDEESLERSGESQGVDHDAVVEENRRIRELRRLVDFSFAFIAQSDISRSQAQRVVVAVKQRAMVLFPGKEATFDLIHGPRFRRLIAEKYRLQ